jgi:hypothetical protein
MQLKALLATVGVATMVSAAPAHALTQLADSTTGGSLFVTVYDPVKNVVVIQDLGLTFSSFASLGASAVTGGAKAFGANAFTSQSFTINLSAFSAAGSNSSDIRWFVFAGDSLGNNASKGNLLTAPSGTGSLTNNLMNNINTSGTAVSAQFNQNCPSATICTDVPAALDPLTWTGNIGGQFPAEADGGFGDSLAFYLVNGQAVTASLPAIVTQFANAAGNWVWSLSSTGTLTYGADAPVPLPAAVWLLLSGLLGVGAVGRRSSAAKLATA